MGIILNLLLVLGALLGILAPLAGLSSIHRSMKIRRTPVRPAGRLDLGNVAVQGKATPLVPQRTPISNRPCAYCTWSVQHMAGCDEENGKISQIAHWTTDTSGTTAEPFYIEDETGRTLVSVNAEDADFELSEDFEYTNVNAAGSGIAVSRPDPHVIEFLEANNIRYHNDYGEPIPIRIGECALEEGGDVFVLGHFSHEEEDINRALAATGDVNIERNAANGIITRPNDRTRAFITRGRRNGLPARMFWRGILFVTAGPPVAAVCAALLYVIWFVI